MKTEIDADGLLTIYAETDLERYALRKWVEENIKGCDLNLGKIQIVTGYQDYKPKKTT
jgi:hypothetical protein